MPLEIERKYLVTSDAWKDGADAGILFRQGYILTQGDATVRVRRAGTRGFLTLKGKPSAAAPLTRAEFEYEIPADEASQLLETLCDPAQIEKTRTKVSFEGHIWEVDVFHGANEGLVLAEIELADENEAFSVPKWVGKEVSDDPRYTNTALARCPLPPK